MNSRRLLALSGLFLGTSAFAVESFLPAAFPASRYDSIVEKSPFSLATPPAPPPQEQVKGFAADYYLTGLGLLDDKTFVSIKSRDLSTNFTLFGNEPNLDGVALVSVDWSPVRGKSTVTIKKGTEFAKLEFNQAEVQAANAPAPPGVRPGLPGQPSIRPAVMPAQMPVINTPAALQPRLNIPRPANVPVFTAPPPLPNANVNVPVTNLPQGTSTNANGEDNRRRIRVINPKP